MRTNRLPWPVTPLLGLLIGELAAGFIWLAGTNGEMGGHRVDVGPYDDFMNVGRFPPVLFARDQFYLVKTEIGGPRALYVYPPPAQAHGRPGRAVTWLEPGDPLSSPGCGNPDGAFRDRCFGATFTRDGAYIFGPSSRGLDQFPVMVKDGHIVIDTRRLICAGPGPCKRL